MVCALAPSLAVLVVARLVQGFAGAGGMVIGRAVIADVVTGPAAAKAFTLMLTVGGVAPVLAPLVGGLLADPVGWRGMLWTVAALCLAMLVGVLVVVPETHPAERRSHGQGATLTAMRTVLGTAAYRRPVAVFSLSFAVMMAYISSSPFVYQNVVGLSEVGYGLAFGANAAGLIAAGWVTSRLVERWSPQQMVRTAVTVQVTACLAFVAARGDRGARVDLPAPDLRGGHVQRRHHGQRGGPRDGAGARGRGRRQRGPRLLPVRPRRRRLAARGPRRRLVGAGPGGRDGGRVRCSASS